jgi:DNA mismatch endonuclease (patch repair protein)
VDVLTPEQRFRNMSRIRGRNTKPEMLLRRGLHAAGLRYRLHAPELPGRPDLLFSRCNAAIFVNGCFWHGHTCRLFRVPATRSDFWMEKIRATQKRDGRVQSALHAAGWRVLVVWECSLTGVSRKPLQDVLSECMAFIRGVEKFGELNGNND